MTAAAASDFDEDGFSSQNAYIIASDTSITVLAAVLEPAKADSVSLLQVGHRGSQLLHDSHDLHKSADTGMHLRNMQQPLRQPMQPAA